MEEAWAVQRSKKAVRGRSDAVQLTRMDYAMKSLSLLYPSSLARHVAVSTSVVTQQLVPKAGADAPRARPCRVSTADRSVRKGITACSLEDLLHKVRDILMLKDKPFSLVLEEDGTAVETEGYFQALAGNTVFMVLQKGQRWQPPADQDFIGCLNVKATFYNTYSLSYDLHCYRAKRIVKEVLRWALFGMRATGHVLLGTSCYVEQLLDATATEEAQPAKTRASSLLPACLKLLP
ncbi:PREDICTED: cell death activator CIDE-3 isoform X3 [Chinchilla lanigera]|uniref:cell death activator CIDE-3 isoform X3 n=1 Tax=Chinchilla lanigera TaxID=34839 RepID=UPI000695A816|nr:PREDICTED: cell death activator CIDE-3 isoform X3 [Chinchilla lanigera]